MVAKITTGSSVRGALSYNERKVGLGQAEILLAAGFSTDIDRLGFTQKLRRFQELNQRNDWIQTNTIHISLNFPADEQLSPQKLRDIAMEYMQRVGFGDQPFLVYRHDDSHHPHIHIVSTTIKANGKSISLHNIAREKSEPARKALEIEFDLAIAEQRNKTIAFKPEPVELRPAEYGREETKAAIGRIVRQVTANYKYTSIQELNAILRAFNVTADAGPQGGAVAHNHGLVYSVLDPEGFKIGVPIKASDLPGRPTLKELEKKFPKNHTKKLLSLPHLRRTLDTLLHRAVDPGRFFQQLKARQLEFQVAGRGGEEDLYLVDHRFKSIYSTTALGWPPNAIFDKLNPTPASPSLAQKLRLQTLETKPDDNPRIYHPTPISIALLNTLLNPTAGFTGGLGSKPRKKKKRRNPWSYPS